MTTDKTPATLAVDALAVMARDAASAFGARHGDREIQEFLGKESDAARSAFADLIEAAERMRDVIHANGCYDDGCFYYFGLSSPELERPLSGIDSALARVKGESA